MRLTADVGARSAGHPTQYATIDYTLTSGLTGPVDLPSRNLNLLVNDNRDDTHRLVINGEADRPVSLRFTEGKLAKVIAASRDALRDIHLDQVGNAEPINRYDEDNRKRVKAFAEDLHASRAWVGACGTASSRASSPGSA